MIDLNGILDCFCKSIIRLVVLAVICAIAFAWVSMRLKGLSQRIDVLERKIEQVPVELQELAKRIRKIGGE